jgi:hypothetical protein
VPVGVLVPVLVPVLVLSLWVREVLTAEIALAWNQSVLEEVVMRVLAQGQAFGLFQQEAVAIVACSA